VADLDVVVRGLLRDIGAALRPFGFRGSSGLWRLVTPEGVAVVQKQAYSGSLPTEKLFFVNTGVAPAAWWEWTNGSDKPMDRAQEYHGLRLAERRVEWTDPAHGYRGDAQMWRVVADTDLDSLRADLVAQTSRAARLMLDLLAPDGYLDWLRARPRKRLADWRPLVVLLAAHGPSPELDAACAGLRAAFAERPGSAGHVDRLVEWARARASR
jgi:hypothetical protein